MKRGGALRQSCYYFKNYGSNFLVLSTERMESEKEFGKMDELSEKIISTLSLKKIGQAK